MVNEELEVEVKEKWAVEDGQFGLYRAIMLCSLELYVCLFVFTYGSCLVHSSSFPVCIHAPFCTSSVTCCSMALSSRPFSDSFRSFPKSTPDY